MSTPVPVVKTLIPLKEGGENKYKSQGFATQDEQVSSIKLFDKSKAIHKILNFSTPCYQ